MKHSLLILGLVALGSSFCGVASAQRTVVERIQDSQTRMLDISAGAYVKPQVVDFKVIPDAEMRSTAKEASAKNSDRAYSVFGTEGRLEAKFALSRTKVEKDLGGVIANVRVYGIFQINKDFNADVLLAPSYDLKTNEAADGYELTIIGYPARFTNFRAISQGDYEWIRLDRAVGATDAEKTKGLVR